MNTCWWKVNGGSRYNLGFVTYLTNVLQPLVRRLPDAEPLWGLLSRGKASSRETYRKELQATVEALRCRLRYDTMHTVTEALLRSGAYDPAAIEPLTGADSGHDRPD